jgi:pimeloyl-ACP methyl ester carboxylesterase
MPTFRSFDGTELNYEEEGAGQPVVLLHGVIANIDLNWRLPGVWQVLVDAGFRPIGLDARGHGKSEKPREVSAYDDNAMAKDVGALFDHLSLDAADVCGYSMGAMTALRFVPGEERVRRLVLGGFGGRSSDDPRERDSFAAAFEGTDESSVPEELLPFRRFALGSGMDMEALRALVRSNYFLGAFDAERIRVPTLVICGEDDHLGPDDLAERVPDAREVLVRGDHFSAVVDPAFAKEIVSFLS